MALSRNSINKGYKMNSLKEISSSMLSILSAGGNSWSERIARYHWKTAGAKETLSRLESLERPMRPIFNKIKVGSMLSDQEYDNLTNFSKDVFKWGGVERSNSQIAENGKIVESVIRAALLWEVPPKGVPMNSGWTKVAALASEFVELDGGSPQIIFDSRVSASILSRLDQVLCEVEDGDPPFSVLPSELSALGFIPGRGGTRIHKGRREHRLKWPNRYQRWDSQFSASFLVNAMRRQLNEDLDEFGKMPHSPYPDGRWSTRGVEMVLFMDGQ